MTTKSIGYGRISTADQNSSSEEDALRAAGVEQIFIDTFTGTKSSRPELNRMKEQLRNSDTIVITRLDRLGRSTKDLLNLVSELDEVGVDLQVIEQNVNTSTPDGKIFFTMVAAFAEFEREIMRSRTLDGLAAARARGRNGERKPALNKQKFDLARSMYADGNSVSNIAEILNVSRPTIYRALEVK